MKPYCSNIISSSVRSGKIAKRSFEPSKGGKGIRLKKAKITFQKMTSKESSKTIVLIEPAIRPETTDQSLKCLIISNLRAVETGVILAIKAKTRAIKMFEPGPPRATSAGPHF